MSSSGRPTDRDEDVAAHTASRDGTLGALRELTADLPDDTPIRVSIRKAHDPDHFYEDVLVESESVHLTHGPVVMLDVEEPVNFDA